MASDDEKRASEGGVDRPQDPIVERLRPDPAQPPQQTLRLSGFLGDSDRPGFRRLYFTPELEYYAEFRVADVVYATPIPAEDDPFPGEEATRVDLRRDATLEYTRTRVAQPPDEFDIDLRLGGRSRFAADRFGACAHTNCDFATCEGTCFTVCQDTCATCQTNCGQDTCQETCATCHTNCGQETCVTCPGMISCETCVGGTCVTCDNGTCNTCFGNTCPCFIFR